MDQIELIQRLTEKQGKLAWFLGAGASQSAGLPTAVDVIWYLKRRHYCAKETQKVSANDLQNPAIREKIDSYMASMGFPATDDPSAYSRCFELIFGEDHKRQREFLSAMLSEKDSALALGHRAFGALIAMGFIKVVFTTNFDTVVERASAEVGGKAVAPFHLEGTYAAKAALNNEEYPVYTKLHGDFRYESLKNLADDLKQQDKELGEAVTIAAGRFGFVVAGYSGRDDSVMELLSAALDAPNPFPHGLFWTGLKGRPPLRAAQALLDKAKTKGVDAAYVEIETFDALMSRLWDQVEHRPPELVSKVGRTGAQAVSIPLPGAGTGRQIARLNALPITVLPDKCLEIDAGRELEWEDLQKAENESKDGLVCTKGSTIWAWGSDKALREAFGSELKINPLTVGSGLGSLDPNPHLKGFLERGIGLALKRGKPLVYRTWRGGSVLILDRTADKNQATKNIKTCTGALVGQVPGLMTIPSEKHPESESVWWAEALRFDVEEVHGQHWLLLRPIVWIWPRHARELATDFLDKKVSGRFNKQADALLTPWIQFLFPGTDKAADHKLIALNGPEGPGNPSFTVNTRTAFTRRLVA